MCILEKISTAQNIQEQFSIKSLLSYFLFLALHSYFLLTLFLPPYVYSSAQVFLLQKNHHSSSAKCQTIR